MRALLVGNPSPLPFLGHVRVRRVLPMGTLHVALRLALGAPPDTAWGLTEKARAALGAVEGGDRYRMINAAWAALRPLDANDLCVLMVAQDRDGVAVTAAGLGAVFVDGRALVPEDHPLLGPPGIPVRTGFYAEEQPGDTYVGVPAGLRWTWGDVDEACGVRRWG